MSKRAELPGIRLREKREAQGYSMKDLAVSCIPIMDYSTVGKVEANKGYTKDTLERFATVLNCSVSDFFYDNNLKNYSQLPENLKTDVGKYINQLLIVAKNKA